MTIHDLNKEFEKSRDLMDNALKKFQPGHGKPKTHKGTFKLFPKSTSKKRK